jgi:NADH-quinone oxidoreductase subunit L
MVTTGPGPAAAAAEGGGAFAPVLIGAVVALPFLGFLVNGAAALWAPRRKAIPTWVGPGVVGASFALVLVNLVALLASGAVEPVVRAYWTWIAAGDFRVDAALQVDRLSLLMAAVVTGVGFLLHVFSVGYMGEDPGYARYFAYLNLFVFFMLVLVLAENFPLLFVGWEGVGLCSYLLIGFWFEQRAKAAAGLKAFIVNRIGDFGFLVGIFLVYAYTGSVSFRQVFAAAPGAFDVGDAAITALTLFLFLGCVGKSAQIPLYVWLPDAMHGPTPVSALIHAATMVTAGVYLVARASVLFAMAPATSAVVATVGIVTAVFAASIALQQYDVKRVIAYSTISQLGYMFAAVGAGAYAAGIFHLFTHAFFKALLFLAAGAVLHAVHRAWVHAGGHPTEEDVQDMRNLGGLKDAMPWTARTAWAGALALAGIWPFAGFFSKDEILWSLAARGWTLLWALGLGAAVLTAVYTARWLALTFYGESRLPPKVRPHVREAPPVLMVPLLALAAGSLLAGWLHVPDALPLLPGVHAFHDFLAPVFRDAEAVWAATAGAPAGEGPLGGGEAAWAAVALGLSAGALVWAFRRTARQRVLPAAEAPEPVGFARLLYRKWYVDEIYDRFVVQPVLRASRFLWLAVDQGVIDGVLVNGSAAATRAAGWALRRLQTGDATAYMLAVVLGVLVWLGVAAWRGGGG